MKFTDGTILSEMDMAFLEMAVCVCLEFLQIAPTGTTVLRTGEDERNTSEITGEVMAVAVKLSDLPNATHRYNHENNIWARL